MKVLVAGWVGSTNLGDELVFAGLRRLLAEHDTEVAVISRNVEATRAVHGVGAVADTDLYGLLRAAGTADLVVFGGGGLLQDTTSPFNLPYHLSRILAARLRGTPVVGVGLGAGALDTRLGRAEVVRGLRPLAGLSVRDRASQQLLTDLGIADVQLGTDLAVALADAGPQSALPEAPSVQPPAALRAGAQPTSLAVCLRPWSGRRGRLPAQARGDATPQQHVDQLAAQLDLIAGRTGLAVRFVALQRDRDDDFHARVASQMRAPSTRVAPALDELLGEVSQATAVVSMRYHGGMAAMLTGRPAVLIGYAAKVGSLAEEFGDAGALLPFEPQALARLAPAVEDVVERAPSVAAARARLLARQEVDRRLLARALSPSPRPPRPQPPPERAAGTTPSARG